MKKLLSLPPNTVDGFHAITGADHTEYFCTSDPAGRKIGSGGGTAWLLGECHRSEAAEVAFPEWLSREKRILLHAGGQSRRLPAYATGGKVLTPVPVFRWERGQRIGQDLLALQMPLYEAIMQKAPASLHTLIASGDVLLRATEPLQEVPEVDVVCYGLWGDPEQNSHHGVFMMNRQTPERLDFMLQKPSTEEQARYMQTHFSLMDIGVWLLSDRAVQRLVQKCGGSDEAIKAYDLYSEFGCALGMNPSRPDHLLSDLSVAILPLPGGEFYHFGTTPELLTSTMAIQNRVKDQRLIIQKEVKHHPSVFTQNARVQSRPGETNEYVWIENACVPETWQYTSHNVITGVPVNRWDIHLAKGQCVDITPIGETQYVLRPYGYHDAFRGAPLDESTEYMGQPLKQWLQLRGLTVDDLGGTADIQAAPLFAVLPDVETLGRWLQWYLSDAPDAAMADEWRALQRLSADGIAACANLGRLVRQREAYACENYPAIARNWPKSVFYQVNLKDMAARFSAGALPLPAVLPETAPLMTRIHDAMFRSEYHRLQIPAVPTAQAESEAEAAKAFGLLREGLTENALRHRCEPRMTTHTDQIVWGRSPVRIDLAGGWTDTPPYSLLMGGSVVNAAIELNGLPPLQVYVKPSHERAIICRSIDLGAIERISTYDELRRFNKVGSPFSIPKAALALAGFLPEYSAHPYSTLEEQLAHFGAGIEVTLLSAVPAGSGLGTSSILAATVLGAVSDFCGLGWDKNEICSRTLVLEQLLTTGGGWQDQYGGVLHGVKMLHTEPGFAQEASARWLPDTLFKDAELLPCHLLYYTGITRTAKHILTEIVRGMFLNNTEHVSLLREMNQHAGTLFEVMQRGDFSEYGRLVRRTWEQNKQLDSGTNPPAVDELCRRVDDFCLGYKLPGAGGGGFMYMVAKDPQAALRIREMLTENPLAPNARFVEMSISDKGLQISRS